MAPERNLRAAVERLGQFGRVRACSTVWQSPPADGADPPDYLNAVVLLETALSAAELRGRAIPAIETGLGRQRTADRGAPRPIDIDIMLFNDDVLTLGQRHIPDPEILRRPFVALALAEIAPDYIHPLTGRTLAELAARFDPEGAGMRRRDDVCLTS